MTGGSTGAGPALAGFEHDYRLAAPLGCGDEVKAVAEGLREECDHPSRGVRRKPVQGVGLGDVDAVADRQETSHAKAAAASLREEHASERSTLAQHADALGISGSSRKGAPWGRSARCVGQPPEVAAVRPPSP